MNRTARDLPRPKIGLRSVIFAALVCAGALGAGPLASLIGSAGSDPCAEACSSGAPAGEPTAPDPEPSPASSEQPSPEPSEGPSPEPSAEPSGGTETRASDPAEPEAPEPATQEAGWTIDAKIVEVNPPTSVHSHTKCLVEAQVLTRNVCLP